MDAWDHDFGKVQEGTKAVHQFRVTNTGTAPLAIYRMNPSCGCTSTVVGQSSLAPGESTGLEVALNTRGMKGPVHKSVVVVTNDPARPNCTLTFEAEVVKPVTASSEDVYFLDLKGQERRKSTVKVESGTALPIHITDIDLSEAPWLGVTTREEGQDLFVDFELVAKRLPRGKRSGTDTVTLHVVDPGPSIVPIRVHWVQHAGAAAKP